jgi:hypothetical protein
VGHDHDAADEEDDAGDPGDLLAAPADQWRSEPAVETG